MSQSSAAQCKLSTAGCLNSVISLFRSLTHIQSRKKKKKLERLNRDFSLGSDCPNSTSTRTCFVGDQQRHYSHLRTRNSHILTLEDTHTHLDPLPAQTEELLQKNKIKKKKHPHMCRDIEGGGESEGGRPRELESGERMCQTDIGHERHQGWIKIHYTEPPDSLPCLHPSFPSLEQ